MKQKPEPQNAMPTPAQTADAPNLPKETQAVDTAALDALRAQYTAALQEERLQHAIDTALLCAGVRNLKTVYPLLNQNDLQLENGIVSGLESQIEQLRVQAPYLFAPDTLSETRVQSGRMHGEPESLDPFLQAAFSAAGL